MRGESREQASLRSVEPVNLPELQRRGPARALREAGRATLAQHPHPFAWAGYVLTGLPD